MTTTEDNAATALRLPTFFVVTEQPQRRRSEVSSVGAYGIGDMIRLVTADIDEAFAFADELYAKLVSDGNRGSIEITEMCGAQTARELKEVMLGRWWRALDSNDQRIWRRFVRSHLPDGPHWMIYSHNSNPSLRRDRLIEAAEILMTLAAAEQKA